MWEWYRVGVAVGIGTGAALVAAGWLPRTRAGALLAILIGVAALALVPFLGYLEALALPAFSARASRRQPERYAGLRTLARD